MNIAGLVNSRVNSIVLKCLETLVKHEPLVYDMTSQSTIVLRFEFIIKNCGNNTVFIVLTVFIIKKCCNGSPFIVSSIYYLISYLLIQNLVLYRGFQTHARDKILLFD